MFAASGHWYHRLELTENYEIWVLTWLPGQHTGFHDHGEASGTFAVVQGELQESLARPGSRRVHRRTAWQGSVSQPRTIDEMLAAARARLARLSPEQASDAASRGAVLVDIRPAAQRAAEGEIPGATIVERNVLEWRFDPASESRLPIARYDLQVIVFCSEGYTSSLAAAALQDLGLHLATDLAGGFCAWRASGLPVTRSPLQSSVS